MDTALFISLLFALQVLYYLVGKKASPKSDQDDDYFLAGKKVPFFPLMMTFVATLVGGGVILGSAEEAYKSGWPIFFYPLGAALGLIVLGLGIGRKLAEFKVSTVAQIFEVVYKSKLLQRFASTLSIISLFTTLIAQLVASNRFLVSMGVTSTILFVLFWAIVILYTARGGLRAVISTDFVQAAFFSFIFITCGAIVWWSYGVPVVENVNFSAAKITGWFLMPLIFMIVGQDVGQRCFAGGSAKIVSRATLCAGLSLIVICIIPVYFGVLAKASGMEIGEGSSVLMTAISTLTNPYLTAIVGCAVLAAIVSTVTSLINAISSNIFTDFIKVNSMGVITTITTIISFVSVGFALYFNSIVEVMFFGYELSACCLCVPLLFALFKKNGDFFAALFSALFGLAGFVIFRAVPLEFPREILALLCSLLGFGVGTLFQKQFASLFSSKEEIAEG